MNLQLITSCIIFLGILLTVYCMFWLSARLRVVARQMEDMEASGDGPNEQRGRQ